MEEDENQVLRQSITDLRNQIREMQQNQLLMQQLLHVNVNQPPQVQPANGNLNAGEWINDYVKKNGGCDIKHKKFCVFFATASGRGVSIGVTVKEVSRILSEEPLIVNVKTQISSMDLDNWKSIITISKICQAVSNVAKLYKLSEANVYQLLRTLLSETFNKIRGATDRIVRDASLKGVLAELEVKLLTENNIRLFRSHVQDFNQRDGQDIAEFFDLFSCRALCLLNCEESPEFKLARSFYYRLCSNMRISYPYQLLGLKSVLLIDVPEQDLTVEQRRKISLESIRKWLELPDTLEFTQSLRESSSVKPKNSSKQKNFKKQKSNEKGSSSERKKEEKVSEGRDGKNDKRNNNKFKKKKSFKSNKEDKDEDESLPVCTFCKRKGHTEDSCFKKVGKEAVEKKKEELKKAKTKDTDSKSEANLCESIVESFATESTMIVGLGAKPEKIEKLYDSIENRKSANVEIVNTVVDDENDIKDFVGKTLKVAAVVNKIPTVVLCDSGADVPIITATLARNLNLELTEFNSLKVKGIGGILVNTVAKTKLKIDIKIGDSVNAFTFYVVEDERGYKLPILPWLAVWKFSIVAKNNVLELGGVQHVLSPEGFYLPLRMELNADCMFDESNDEGIEELVNEFEANTMESDFISNQAKDQSKIFLKDHVVEKVERPNKENWEEIEKTGITKKQIDWIMEAVKILKLNIDQDKITQLNLSEDEDMRNLFGNLLDQLFLSHELIKDGRLPVMLNSKGEPCKFDIELTRKNFSFITPVRHHNKKKLEVLDENLKTAETMGIVKKLDPKTTPNVVLETVFALKGSTIRPCLDATVVNSVTKDMPMLEVPSIDDLTIGINPEDLAFMSKFDITKAYMLIECTDNAASLLVVRGVDGFYRYLRMPFGAKNSPAVWQAATADLVHDLRKNARKQTDDVLVFAKDPKTLLSIMLTLVSRCNVRRIPLKAAKMEVFKDELKFAGRLWKSDGSIGILDEHLNRILNLKNPNSDIGAVRTLVGIAEWLSRYVPGLASYIAPFTDTLKTTKLDGVTLKTKELESHFQKLQEQIKKHVRLRLLDDNKCVCIMCDACDGAISAVLLQPTDEKAFKEAKGVLNYKGSFVIVNLLAKKLNQSQAKWPIIEKEGFSIVHALSRWRERLLGMDIFVFNDHLPLKFIFNVLLTGVGPPRIHRWIILLMGIKFTLDYVPGKHNQIADVVNRYLLFEPGANSNIVSLKPLDKSIYVSTLVSEAELVLENKLFVEKQAEDNLVKIVTIINSGRTKEEIETELQQFDQILVKFVKSNMGCFKFIGKLLFYEEEQHHHPKLYVPEEQRKTVFEAYHCSFWGAHASFLKTFEIISRFAWWQNMRQDIEKWSKSCHQCQTGKYAGTNLKVKFNQEKIMQKPFFKIQIDWKPCSIKSARGFTGVFVFVDEATKFQIWVPAFTNDAKSAAKALVDNVILMFGCPQIIKTGEDKEWFNRLTREIVSLLGISHEVGLAYRPQGIALNERRHKEMDDIFRTSLIGENFDLLVRIGAFVINNRVDSSIGMTPFRALFGRDPLNPYDSAIVALFLHNMNVDTFDDMSLSQWIEKLKSGVRLREVKAEFASRYAKSKFEAKKGKGSDKKQAEVGDIVAVKANQKSKLNQNKNSPIWLAPFEIVKVTDDKSTVTLEYIPDRKIVLKRDVADVKIYYRDEDDIQSDTWIDSGSYEIDEIVDVRGNEEEREYLIHWRNFPEEFDSWEPRENIDDERVWQKAETTFKSKIDTLNKEVSKPSSRSKKGRK